MSLVWAQTFFLVKGAAENGNSKSALALGIGVGLCAAQHAITILALPAFGISAWLLLRGSVGRWRHLAVMAVGFGITGPGLFFSLPFLRTQSVWPDWGRLGFHPGEIMSHALRTEYGTFELAATGGSKTHDALILFARALLSEWHLAVLLVGVGLWAVHRRNRWIKGALWGGLLLSLFFLFRAQLGAEEVLAWAILSRFFGVALIPTALFLGLGVKVVEEQLERPLSRVVGAALVAVFIVILGYRAAPAADFSQTNSTEVYRQALGRALPPTAVFLCTGDLEVFGGVVDSQGRLRHCIAPGLLGLDWYIQEVVPRLEPRLASKKSPASDVTRLVSAIHQAGISVVATTAAHFAASGSVPRMEGLYFRLPPPGEANDQDVGPWTVDAALKLCPDLERLAPLPPRGHHHARLHFHAFARAFDAAAFVLNAQGKSGPAKHATEVTRALQGAQDAVTWKKACGDLTQALSAHGHRPSPVPDSQDNGAQAPSGGQDGSGHP
jgi:hypothetical protein